MPALCSINLVNGWVSAGFGLQSPYYYRMDNGNIVLMGSVYNPTPQTQGTVIGNIPDSTCRPKKNLILKCWSGSGSPTQTARIDLQTDGNLVFYNGGQYVSFDGQSFTPNFIAYSRYVNVWLKIIYFPGANEISIDRMI